MIDSPASAQKYARWRSFGDRERLLLSRTTEEWVLDDFLLHDDHVRSDLPFVPSFPFLDSARTLARGRSTLADLGEIGGNRGMDRAQTSSLPGRFASIVSPICGTECRGRLYDRANFRRRTYENQNAFDRCSSDGGLCGRAKPA